MYIHKIHTVIFLELNWSFHKIEGINRSYKMIFLRVKKAIFQDLNL